MPDPKEIDYRDLLKRYMKLIIDHESIDYLRYIRGGSLVAHKTFDFSDEDIEELKQISKEIEQ